MIAPPLTRAAQRHIRQMLTAMVPASARLNRMFRAELREHQYDAQQVRAFLAIIPVAASAMRSVATFFEQVQKQGTLLAKLNLPPAEIQEKLREFDGIAGLLLKGRYAPAREQFQLATMLVLDQAFYQVREAEAQAFFGLYRAEIEAKSLDDLLRRIVRILVRTFGARSGRLVLMDGAPPARLARPQYFADGGGLVLDPAMRGHYESYWSYPLCGAGVLQLGFADRHRWLPRDLTLLAAAAERCCEAIEYRRMQARERTSEENERGRIGRELHDEAGQSLLLLRLELEMLERRAPEDLRQPLRNARAIVEKTVEELRRIVGALSPALLERLGLKAALRQLAARFQRTCGSKLKLRLAACSALSLETQQVIYRVAQECLQNAAKHSQATAVNLSLWETDRSIRLGVSDNGAGFGVNAAGAKPLAFGLAGMRERAALLGGTLTIRSAPGNGASVILQLPRNPERTTIHGKDSLTSH